MSRYTRDHRFKILSEEEEEEEEEILHAKHQNVSNTYRRLGVQSSHSEWMLGWRRRRRRRRIGPSPHCWFNNHVYSI
jgi:hypothetical protein